MSSKYKNEYGPLTLALHIPVDSRMRFICDQSKAKNFDFNAWARDVLNACMQEVLDECGISDPKMSSD